MEVLNFVTVTLYGNVIMYLFTEEEKDRMRLLGFAALYLFCEALNLFLHRHFSEELLYMLYPFTVHLPLSVFFIVFEIYFLNICQKRLNCVTEGICLMCSCILSRNLRNT